jgi:class 3 adenylate cyclase/predicted ATPase
MKGTIDWRDVKTCQVFQKIKISGTMINIVPEIFVPTEVFRRSVIRHMRTAFCMVQYLASITGGSYGMKCSHCGFENPPGFNFCGKCGTALGPQCANCGFKNPPGFLFCGKCGTGLTLDANAPVINNIVIVPPPPPTRLDRLTQEQIDHLKVYLPATLIESLQDDLAAPSDKLLEQCIFTLAKLLEVTTTQLPGYLVDQVLRDPVAGHAAGQFVTGTLLFADISGFTAMSEKLSRIGREGAEEVTAIVNKYFASMLSIMRKHGGQLIKFGGDALLGLFLEPPIGSAARAGRAALQMQVAMGEFAQTRTSQGTFPLQMKVSLHYGRFFAAQVGTTDKMEYALFGKDVNITAAIANAAVAGQVLLDKPTIDAISVALTTEPVNEQYYRLDKIEPVQFSASATMQIPTVSGSPLERLKQATKYLDALTPFLPTGLISRMVDSSSAGPVLEGEHRLVSVLFANINGLDEIADRMEVGREDQIVDVLNQWFVAMQIAIQKFGGVINKIDLYDHGDKLLAFFGAPIAHEDDAERAVRTALAMQSAFAELKHKLAATNEVARDLIEHQHFTQHIGLSYGYVYAGYVGSEWRREYTVMGDEVNLSARLMTTAQDNQSIVSEGVRRKVKALFDLNPEGEVKLKGKANPVPIFSVTGERAVPESLRGLEGMHSSLVGRDEELRSLSGAFDQALNGRGQIARVMGEAGLGKSRLVAELRRNYPQFAQEHRWSVGRCLSYTESVSYFPFRELVRDLLKFKSEDETEAHQLRVVMQESFSDEELDSMLPYLASFLNLSMGEELEEKIKYLDAEALQRRMFAAVRNLIELRTPVGGSPLVLMLEDIQWMDQTSLSLLDNLLPLINRLPLLIILIYRPERESASWRIHEKISREYQHATVDVQLHGLAPVDSQRLLMNLVPMAEWPPAIQNMILSRTEGNPLYVEEVIRALIDEGVLVHEADGAWHSTAQKDSINVPDTLQGVMMTRLDRLAEAPRRIAQVASVAGRTIAYEILAHSIAEDDARLTQGLVQLQQHEIVHETQRAPELIYAFTHALMREVCYNSLLARTRRDYHRQIAEYLEATKADRAAQAEEITALIAYHAFNGQDWSRALKYQVIAGQSAERLFANHEAIDHFEKAAQSAGNLPAGETSKERQMIHMALGELLTSVGQFDKAQEQLDEAFDLAKQHDDVDAQAHVCWWRARLHEQRGEYAQAFEWIDRGLKPLGDRQIAEAAQLKLLAGLIYSRQGNRDRALANGQEALQIAEQLGELTVIGRAKVLIGHLNRLMGESTVAIENFQEAFDLYQRAGDVQGQAQARNQLANAYFNLGQWHEADEHYRVARDLFGTIGNVYNRAFADSNLGGIALNQGRLDDALNSYQQALSGLEQIGGSPYVLGVVRMNLGAVLNRRGDVPAARDHLARSQEYFDQAQSRDFLPELRRHLSTAALLSNDLAEAELWANNALDLARELSMRGEEGIALRALAEVSLAQQKTDAALERVVESVKILHEVKDDYQLARSRLLLAQIYIGQGNRAAASSALNQCIKVFERLEASLDLEAARELKKKL